MIIKLINKDTTNLSRSKVLEHFEEIAKKRKIILSLIRETTIKEDYNIDENKSPLSVLCESSTSLQRIYEMLSRLLVEYNNKAQVRINDVVASTYIAHWASLTVYQHELKNLFNIVILPDIEIN